MTEDRVDGARARPRRARRVVVSVGLVLVALLVLGTVTTYRLFVWPPTDTPTQADAVVVFAGADGERQAEGARLVQEGVAPVLVVSDGGRPQLEKYRVCRTPGQVKVICFSPDEDDTRSEAQEFARLAAENDWRSLVMVTSVTHVERAHLLLTRCYDGQVQTVGTPLRNDHSYETGLQIAHEWVALVRAWTLERGC